MKHRKTLSAALMLIVALLALVTSITPVLAQELPGLSEEDAALLSGAIQNTVFQDSYTFEFVFSLNANVDGQAVNTTINGSGIVIGGASLETQFQLAVDGEAETPDGTVPLVAEIRVIDNVLYLNAVNPDTGEESGWLGDTLDNIGASMGAAFSSGFSAEAGISPEALMGGGMMDQALDQFGDFDPTVFLSVERGGSESVGGVDTTRFTYNFDIAELASSDQIAGLLFGAMAGAGQMPEMPSESQMAMLAPMLSQLFGETSFTIDQYIDEAESLVRRTVITFNMNLDPSMMGATGEPALINLSFDVTLDNFGNAPEVEVPADAQMGFASQLAPGGFEAPSVAVPTLAPMPTQESADAEPQTSDSGGDLVIEANVPLTVEYNGSPVDIAYESAGGEVVTVVAHSLENTLDTTIEVIDPSGVSLSRNDDHGSERGGLNTFDSLISDLELEDAGTYTIRLDTFSGSGEGSVEVTVENAGGAEPGKGDEGGGAAVEGEQVIAAEVPDNGDFEYEFEGAAGQVVTIAARATDSSFDPVIELDDPSGDTVAENDDHGTDREDLARFDSMIQDYELESSGTYTIRVRGFAGSGGEFDLLLSIAGEGESSGGSQTSGASDVVTDRIRAGDTFQYELDANEGDMYTVTVRALDEDLDPVLALYDAASGSFVASNDDHGSSDGSLNFLDSRLERFIFTESGSYIIEVSGYGDSSGDFELTVEQIMTDAPTGSGDEEVFTGEIEAGDSFIQTFEAREGDIVTITVRALTSDFDASVSLISPDGVVLADNDDHGGSDVNLSFLDSRINNFIVTEDGEYTIEVTGYRDSEGSFALIINVK